MKIAELASEYVRERRLKDAAVDVFLLGGIALHLKVIYEGVKAKQLRDKEET